MMMLRLRDVTWQKLLDGAVWYKAVPLYVCRIALVLYKI
jgi:hypothetical protein